MVSFLFQIGVLVAYVIGAGLNLWEIYQTENYELNKKKAFYIARAISVAGFIVFGILLGTWGLYIPAIGEFIFSAVLLSSKACKSGASNLVP